MSRFLSSASLAGGVVVLFLACSSDDLAPRANDGGGGDVASSDGVPLSDGAPLADGAPLSDGAPLADGAPLFDLGPGGCYQNLDCDVESFCKFAEGCGGPGMCVGRPPYGCPDMFDPQCGCDGFTWDSPCEAALNGVNIIHPGGCSTPSACASNSECEPEEFCNLDFDCAGSSPQGTCEPKPPNCYFPYAPVCGCDNVDYKNACEAHSSGVSVLHNFRCGSIDLALCEQLNTAYVAAVSAAQVCKDDGGPEVACDTLVQDAMECGCPTYITSEDANVQSTLDQLGVDWVAAGCNQIGRNCPGCAPPRGVDCLLDMDGVGTCVEY